MALINCPDCGHQVSDIAPACPNCGRPIGKPEKQKKPKEGFFLQTMNVGCFIVFVILIIGVIGAVKSCQEAQHKQSQVGDTNTKIKNAESFIFPLKMEIVNNNIYHLSEPHVGAERLGQYQAGQIVKALARDGDWFKVSKGFFSLDGWIHKSNLVPTK